MSELRAAVVDAFTDEAFGGNPAGVCLLETMPDDDWMRSVAAEMKHSETAFLQPRGEQGHYDLRWFTPVAEVNLCGHATLASSHALWQEFGEASETLTFHTRSGELTAVREEGRVRLDFPSDPPEKTRDTADVLHAIGQQVRYAGRGPGTGWMIYEIDTAEEVRRLKPDMEAVLRLSDHGIIVTARGDGGFDMVSRVFVPALGVPEDPVTGSAHTVLGPYWAKKLSRGQMHARQASPRGGELTVRMKGERVQLVGSAVTVLVGTLRV